MRRDARLTLRAAGALVAALVVASAPSDVRARDAGGSAPGVRVAIAHALPPLDGGRLRGTLVEVTYGPGEASAPHSHACPVVAYVVSGAVRSQVRGGAAGVYRAGESFYEAPDGVHVVSQNASDRVPARLLAYFVCDRDVPLSVGLPEAR